MWCQVGTGNIGGTLCKVYDYLTTMLHTWTWYKIILKVNSNWKKNKKWTQSLNIVQTGYIRKEHPPSLMRTYGLHSDRLMLCWLTGSCLLLWFHCWLEILDYFPTHSCGFMCFYSTLQQLFFWRVGAYIYPFGSLSVVSSWCDPLGSGIGYKYICSHPYASTAWLDEQALHFCIPGWQ